MMIREHRVGKVRRSNLYPDTLCHFNPNHDPRNGQFTSKNSIVYKSFKARRLINPDGTLTDRGSSAQNKTFRDVRQSRHVSANNSDDIVIEKGKAANRVVRTRANDYRIKTDKEISEDEAKKTNKFYSVDDVLNRGHVGRDFYASWFGDAGWDPDIRIDDYKFKKDIRVANGSKVLNELLNIHGEQTVGQLVGQTGLGQYADYRNLDLRSAINMSSENATTDKYTKTARILEERVDIGNKVLNKLTSEIMNEQISSELFNRMKKKGYEAIEDIHDRNTQLPIVLFDANKYLTKTGSESGHDYFTKRGIRYV